MTACGLIVIGSAAQGAKQQPAPAELLLRSPSPLRISVELVQLDATVTDENGRHVTSLEAAEFEVLQDNRPQTIAAFQTPGSYLLAISVTDRGAKKPRRATQSIDFEVID